MSENVLTVLYVSLNPQIYLLRFIPFNSISLSAFPSVFKFPCAVVYFLVYLAILLKKKIGLLFLCINMSDDKKEIQQKFLFFPVCFLKIIFLSQHAYVFLQFSMNFLKHSTFSPLILSLVCCVHPFFKLSHVPVISSFIEDEMLM